MGLLDGKVALVEANPEQFTELTSFQAIEGLTWNNPCLYGKLLLVLAAQDRDAADGVGVRVETAERTGKGQFSGRAGNEGGARSHRFEVPLSTCVKPILAVRELEC